MDKYIISIETWDGFVSQIHDGTFDSIEQFTDWLYTKNFEDFVTDMKVNYLELQNAVTLEAVMAFDVEYEIDDNIVIYLERIK